MSLSLFSKTLKLFSAPEFAIDLGTAGTRVYAADHGLVADEPTAVKINHQTSQSDLDSEANDASEEQFDVVLPLEGGVVKDESAASLFLRNLLQKVPRRGFLSSRAIVCAPSDVSSRERCALLEVVRSAGISSVKIVPEPLAAAIGAGLDLSSPYAQMLVDIGDGVTDIAVIRNGKLIKATAVRTAGSDLRAAVRQMVKERYRIKLSKNEAELLTRKLGAVGANKPWTSFMLTHGINRQHQEVAITVHSKEVCEAIKPITNIIGETVRRAVKEMPPTSCAEVIETGLCLTGGVAELPEIVEFIAAETNLEVKIAPEPLYSVINGASRMLETARETNLWVN